MTQKNSATSFFIIEGDKVLVNPKALLIPEFAFIHERDRSQNKRKSTKEFAYVYYMSDYKSEYNAYGLNKQEQIGKDIFGNKRFKPEKYLLDAIEKYKALQQSPSMRYLESIRNRVNRLIAFLDSADVKDKDKDGNSLNPWMTIDKTTKVLNELEDVVEKLEKWEKKVFDEEEDMQIRGGGVLNAFENPEDARWLFEK